jgi:hypothetical protein
MWDTQGDFSTTHPLPVVKVSQHFLIVGCTRLKIQEGEGKNIKGWYAIVGFISILLIVF